MNIFLDESGQFTSCNGHQYFVIGSFTVGNHRRTEKAFRSWCNSKFPKRMRYQSEIKWSSTGIDESLRLKTIKHISQMDVRIRFTYLLKENIPTEFMKKNKKLNDGHLYMSIIGETLNMYLPTSDKEFRVFCDKRHLKGVKEAEFKRVVRARLLPSFSRGSIIQIEMVDSKANTNIQIADWIVGAIARFLEKKTNGKEYFDLLKNNIIDEGRELFTKQ